MPKAFSPIALQPSRNFAAFALPRPRPWRLDLSSVEIELARAFGVIRECARIAWWDGSAIGLRLHGFFGLFDALDLRPGSDRGDLP